VPASAQVEVEVEVEAKPETARPVTTNDAARASEAGADGCDHPLVKQAMELFGARIVDVQHRRST
jgi:hypothetical protein